MADRTLGAVIQEGAIKPVLIVFCAAPMDSAVAAAKAEGAYVLDPPTLRFNSSIACASQGRRPCAWP